MSLYPPDTLSRLQQIELEILDVIAAICNQEGITWFLIGGSALGAVRHRGFIPWDDDIDIGLLRPDYNRFLEVAAEKLPNGYNLSIPGITPGHAAMFAKVHKVGTRFFTQETIDANFEQGIFVDIFPFDAIWAKDSKRMRQYHLARRYTRMSYLLHSSNINLHFDGVAGAILPIVFKSVHIILKHTTNAKKIQCNFNNNAIACPEAESCGYTSLAHPYSGALPKSSFVPPVFAEFESRRYPIPADYTRYLKDHYDEHWMKLPPENARKSHAPLILDFGDGINVVA